MRHRNAALGLLALAAFFIVLARAPRIVRIAYLVALAIRGVYCSSRCNMAGARIAPKNY